VVYWNSNVANAAKAREVASYFDLVNFAPRVKCATLVGTGLIDETCAPAGVLAMYNQLAGPKQILIMEKAEHMNKNNSQGAFWNVAGRWQEQIRGGDYALPAR
jgi:cephalosporin-C deacetylase-like acetyl esterase